MFRFVSVSGYKSNCKLLSKVSLHYTAIEKNIEIKREENKSKNCCLPLTPSLLLSLDVFDPVDPHRFCCLLSTLTGITDWTHLSGNQCLPFSRQKKEFRYFHNIVCQLRPSPLVSRSAPTGIAFCRWHPEW